MGSKGKASGLLVACNVRFAPIAVINKSAVLQVHLHAMAAMLFDIVGQPSVLCGRAGYLGPLQFWEPDSEKLTPLLRRLVKIGAGYAYRA